MQTATWSPGCTPASRSTWLSRLAAASSSANVCVKPEPPMMSGRLVGCGLRRRHPGYMRRKVADGTFGAWTRPSRFAALDQPARRRRGRSTCMCSLLMRPRSPRRLRTDEVDRRARRARRRVRRADARRRCIAVDAAAADAATRRTTTTRATRSSTRCSSAASGCRSRCRSSRSRSAAGSACRSSASACPATSWSATEPPDLFGDPFHGGAIVRPRRAGRRVAAAGRARVSRSTSSHLAPVDRRARS